MRSQILGSVTAFSLLLTACSSAKDSAPSVCDSVIKAHDKHLIELDKWFAKYPQYKALKGTEFWSKLEETDPETRRAMNIVAQIEVDNPECFDPSAVAQLELLGWRKGGTSNTLNGRT